VQNCLFLLPFTEQAVAVMWTVKLGTSLVYFFYSYVASTDIVLNLYAETMSSCGVGHVFV